MQYTYMSSRKRRLHNMKVFKLLKTHGFREKYDIPEVFFADYPKEFYLAYWKVQVSEEIKNIA